MLLPSPLADQLLATPIQTISKTCLKLSAEGNLLVLGTHKSPPHFLLVLVQMGIELVGISEVFSTLFQHAGLPLQRVQAPVLLLPLEHPLLPLQVFHVPDCLHPVTIHFICT